MPFSVESFPAATVDPSGLPYTDFKLDTSGDWDMTGGYLQRVSGLEAVAQHLQMRLSMFAGEWFLDQSLGWIDYENVLTKAPSIPVITALCHQVISETPGVKDIKKLELIFTPETRTLAITLEATADLGRLFGTIEV